MPQIDFADFWQTIEEKGFRGWLNHRYRYAIGQGCFPSRVAISRKHDIISLPIEIPIIVAIGWVALHNITTVSGSW